MVYPFYANDPLEHLGARLSNAGKFITPGTRHKTLTELINIYARLDAIKPKKCAAIWCDDTGLPPYLSAKRSIIELVVIGLYDNSPEADEFILARLSDSNPEFFEITRVAMYRSKQKSDKIYDKISELAAKGRLTEERALALKMRINYDRALPEIRERLTTTTNKKEFSSLVRELGYKKDSTVLDLIFERCPTFTDSSYIVQGMDPIVLDAYLITAEGERFKRAINVISPIGTFFFYRKDEMGFYKKKLESKNPITREVMVEYITTVTIPTVLGEIRWGKNSHEVAATLKLLEDTAKKETNPKIRAKIDNLLTHTREELRKQGKSF